MSIRLDPEVNAALQELAAAAEHTLSVYVNRVLRQHIDPMRRRPKAKSGNT